MPLKFIGLKKNVEYYESKLLTCDFEAIEATEGNDAENEITFRLGCVDVIGKKRHVLAALLELDRQSVLSPTYKTMVDQIKTIYS
ncbi:MAG: hypothetical protein HRU19_29365 [Pseudobacteriovorax sp.]|nr:hypothetical protein [Pseudobacteriovorax sp.]